MNVFEAIVLGIVQGLTEFLPVSSSGHLIIFPWLFGWDEPGLAFDAALHLGTLAAVFAYFWREILAMVAAIPTALRRPVGLLARSGEDLTDRECDARLGLLIAIGTIPGLVAGLLWQDAIDEAFHSGGHSNRAIVTVATMLIVVGVLMYVAERVAVHRRMLTGVGWIDAVIIGCAQAVALIPGTSRSGATITAGLFRSLRRADAARFSFLLGSPLVLAAGLKAVVDAAGEGMSGSELTNFIAGGVAAAVVGFFAIGGLLRFLQRSSTVVFVIYRIAFAIFLLIMLAVR